jgi:hypothetical protein
MILYCKHGKCKTRLSNKVVELTDKTLLCFNDKEAHIPKGYYHHLTEEDRDNGIAGEIGEYILNLGDLINPKPCGRRNGCDGCDGMNLACTNGHAFGTECSDCWMCHYVHIAPDTVEPHDGVMRIKRKKQ